MPLFLLLIAALVGWAIATGRLKKVTYEDAVAAVLFILGLRLLTTGRPLPGAALMTVALLWGAWRRKRATPPPRSSSSAMRPDEARALLGVGPAADLAEVREAHRRLIARVHPDVGGSAELAHRINMARDTLVAAEMNRRAPRAS